MVLFAAGFPPTKIGGLTPESSSSLTVYSIDWLVDVAVNYKLRPLDSVLYGVADRPVPRSPPCHTKQWQLVSVAAMLIASKFEEICPPEVQDFVYFTSGAYTRDELIERRFGCLPPWNSPSRLSRLPISWSALDSSTDVQDRGTSLSYLSQIVL